MTPIAAVKDLTIKACSSIFRNFKSSFNAIFKEFKSSFVAKLLLRMFDNSSSDASAIVSARPAFFNLVS